MKILVRDRYDRLFVNPSVAKALLWAIPTIIFAVLGVISYETGLLKVFFGVIATIVACGLFILGIIGILWLCESVGKREELRRALKRGNENETNS